VGSVVAAAVTCAPDPLDVEGVLDVVPAEVAGALLDVVLAEVARALLDVVPAEVARALLDAGALLDEGVGVGAEWAGTVSRPRNASAAVIPTARARLRLAVIQGSFRAGTQAIRPNELVRLNPVCRDGFQ
jgi:hypothetical protein